MNSTTTYDQGDMTHNGMTHDGMTHSDAYSEEPKEGSFVSPSHHESDPVQDLIDSTEHTHTAIKSGKWSDPNTWRNGRVPDDGANVLIPEGVKVTYDTVSDSEIETVSIEGRLDFSTNKDTQLKVETILNGGSGELNIGYEDKPIDADHEARIIFTSDSAIQDNADWDPDQLSKGLVSTGAVGIYGADKTDHVALVADAEKGDDVLYLSEAPEGWQVGDQVVLGGTSYDSRGSDSDNSRFQDEVLTITSIDGNEVRFINEDIEKGDRDVLRYDHTRSDLADSADELSLYVGNVKRNVALETENGEDVPIENRAHVMLMHNPDINVLNAGFYELGRSDKTEFVDDPVENVDGSKGNGTNARGRYSLHLHRTGTGGSAEEASIVRGNAVVGSPGWGIVQHDSHAGLEDNVVFDVAGAGISAEAGNETGWWTNNLTIKTTGIPTTEFNRQSYKREELYDFGVQGSGYWVQGAAQIENKDNKAVSSNAAGMDLFGGSLDEDNIRDATTLEISSLSPELQALFPEGQTEVDISDVPMATVEGFESYNANTGLRVWGHNTNFNGELAFNTTDPETAHEGRSTIEDATVWGNRNRGISVQYSSNVDVKDSLVLGNDEGTLYAYGAGLLNNQASYGTEFDNVTVAGFEVGADIAKPNNDKEFISSTVSNSDFSDNTYHLTEAGVPLAQGGYNDFAAYTQLENNKFEDVSGNAAPTAKFEAEALGGLAYEFDASDSFDRDPLEGSNPNVNKLDSSGIASYGWDLDNDGTIDRYGRNITHVFDNAGEQTVSLTVWDNQGQTTTYNQTLSVEPTDYTNAFVNSSFSDSTIQIPGNDNSQWADQGWYATRGVKVSDGAGKLSVRGDRSNYIGQVVQNDKVHQGTQTLSYDLKNIDAGKSEFDANEVTVEFWGVNGQFENGANGPEQVGTLPMESTLLSIETFNADNDGLFDWTTISTEVDLGEGYDYLLFEVNGTGIDDAKDYVAIDKLSLTGEANSNGNNGNSSGPTNPSEPENPSEPTNPSEPNNPSEPTNPTFPTELEPVAHITFDNIDGALAVDTSSAGKQNDATLKNATLSNGQFGEAAEFEGGKRSGASIKNSTDINLGTHDERTISLWFKAEDLESGEKQVIYEEGGRVRGLNMYIEDDLLHFGGWSNKGGWSDGSWITTDQIVEDQWHHVALVLDGDDQLQPDAMTAYLDGEEIGRAEGTQMWQHNDGIGIGNTKGSTRFADGTTGSRMGLDGSIDEVQIYNDALSASQVQQLSGGDFL